jgi:Fic family protein
MFKPKYTITAKLLANIKHITELISELNQYHFPRVVLAKMERTARELSAFASTSIEGNPLPLTEVKKILKNHPKRVRDTEREVLNYNSALEKLDKLQQHKITPFSLELILKLHGWIMEKLIDKFRCGQIRKGAVFVNDPRKGTTVYWPPDAADCKTLLEELIGFIKSQKTTVDPLILAGIFHKQFVIIHPFMDGNGRTARLATKVLLAALGLNTFNLFSFENYYNRNVTKYFEKVGVLNNYYDIYPRINFTGWLEYFTDGILDELLRVKKELQAVALSPATTLKPTHQKILNHIRKHGFITDKDYASLTDRSKAARNKDFNKLISLDLIEKQGKGKATYYRLLPHTA